MRRVRAFTFWVATGLLGTAACKESNPLPPGNWQGRCPAPDSNAPSDFGPPPTTFVHDRAQMLRPNAVAPLEAALSAFHQETCHEVSFVSVPSLDGKTLEAYSQEYANRVGLGYRRLNNGVMLLISPKTRQARIEIGCGLEDVITDAEARAIMQRDLLPNFTDGYWTDGVKTGLASLMALARKKTIAESFRPEGCRKGARPSGG